MKESFNSAQKEICDITDRPILLIAQSGTGKTTALAHRIVNLIKTKKVLADNIYSFSSSNTQALRLKAKVKKILNQKAISCHFLQINQYFAFLLREHGGNNQENIRLTLISNEVQNKIIIKIFKTILKNEKSKLPYNAVNIIKAIKQTIQEPFTFLKKQNCPYLSDTLMTVLHKYNEYLQKYHYFDEEDLVLKLIKLCNKKPELVQKIKANLKEVIINNFEDYSALQQQLILRLTNGNPLISLDLTQKIAGDPYQFQEYDIPAMITKAYPKIKTIELVQNYRTTKGILQAASSIYHQETTPKICTHNPKGEPLQYFIGYDEAEEAEYIAHKIHDLHKKEHIPLNKIAIFIRLPMQIEKITRALERYKITPHVQNGSSPLSQEIQDFIAYIKFAFNQQDIFALLEILSNPVFKIKRTKIVKIQKYLENTSESLVSCLQKADFPCTKQEKNNIATMINNISKLILDYQKSKKINRLAAFLTGLLSKTQYQQKLEQENTLAALEKIENINEFIAALKPIYCTIEQIIDATALTKDLLYNDQFLPTVAIIHLHKTKHAEFDFVFIAGVEEGIVPFFKSIMNEPMMQQERRQFFQSLTSAKKSVFLTSVSRRHMYSKIWYDDISIFIKEIPKKLLVSFVSEKLIEKNDDIITKLIDEQIAFDSIKIKTAGLKENSLTQRHLRKGDHVLHNQWGEGIVKTINHQGKDIIIEVAFKDQSRKLMAKYVSLFIKSS
jgi:DNA helicase-2/ATP-dependent DNA helicase PcrA